MYFKTESGSIYEVDEADKRIRRIHGNRKPTERQGEDGDWKRYFALKQVMGAYLICWNDDSQCTLTSAIVKTAEKFDEVVSVH